MTRRVHLIALPTLAILAACGGNDAKKIDDALRQDLSLASQSYVPQPYVSPAEQGYTNGYGYAAPRAGGGPYATPVATRAPSSGRIYRAGSTGTARQGRIVKQTKRDAAIGAVAGAAIGAVTSRDKLKGAVLGAAAGSILGAVLGNNVDKKRVPD